MTNFTKAGLVMTLLLTTIFTYASHRKGDYILNIATGNGKIISFNLESTEKSTFSIFDEKHNLVYSGESATNNLEVSKTISLENYAAGTYFLEVTQNGKVEKHEIKVTAQKSKVTKLDPTVNQSPSLRR